MIKIDQSGQAVPLAETIIQATGSAAGLIKRMQHLTARQPRERRPVSLHRIVEQTVQLFRQHLDDSFVVSTALNAQCFSLQGDEPPVTPLAGALQASDSYVVLSVEDSGKGMDPETLRRIFQPFFTTRAANGGTGLGLLSVEATVTAHGGAICVESEPGEGSRFALYLPVDPNLVLSPDQNTK